MPNNPGGRPVRAEYADLAFERGADAALELPKRECELAPGTLVDLDVRGDMRRAVEDRHAVDAPRHADTEHVGDRGEDVLGPKVAV
jgi:hypothetical protein